MASIAREPLVYGQHDCALMCADAVEAMTGEYLADGVAGLYETEEEGRAIVPDIPALLTERGMVEVMPAIMAQRGDVAILDGGAMGIVMGPDIYVIRDAGGIGTVPITRADRVFRVMP